MAQLYQTLPDKVDEDNYWLQRLYGSGSQTFWAADPLAAWPTLKIF